MPCVGRSTSSTKSSSQAATQKIPNYARLVGLPISWPSSDPELACILVDHAEPRCTECSPRHGAGLDRDSHCWINLLLTLEIGNADQERSRSIS